MSKKRSINDQIVDLLKPKEIQDPEQADGDELTLAKVSEFDEGVGEDDIDDRKRLSEIRKRNVTDVTKTDRKYKGQVVSRAELEDDFESSEEEVDEDEDEKYAIDTDDEEMEEEGSLSGEEEEEEFGSDEESNDESEAEEPDNDDDIETNMILRPEAQNEKVRQGKAVKLQLQLWEKLLEMRIKSQKLLTLANSLPFGATFDHLHSNSEYQQAISSTTDAILTLIDKNRDLQTALVQQFPESKDIPKPSRKRKLSPDATLDTKRAHIDHLWSDLDTFTSNYKPYRNAVIQKWHDRTKIATNVKSLKTMENQSIIQKIDNTLLNRNDLIRKTQIYRGGYEIIGNPIQPVSHVDTTTEATELDPNDMSSIPVKKDPNTYVSEIYDDSEFYHQLLRELIEFKTSTSSNPQELEQKYQELHQLRNKMKKSVDTRASKGRKIRYVVHNKLVNFMAPVPDASNWTEEAKTELYNSLFDKLLTKVDV